MIGNLPEVLPQVQAGRLRAIALTGNARSSLLPDVPTFAEAGFPQIQAQSWFGMFAPSGVPAPIVAKLSDDIAAAVATPAVRKQLEGIGGQCAVAPESRTNSPQPCTSAATKGWNSA